MIPICLLVKCIIEVYFYIHTLYFIIFYNVLAFSLFFIAVLHDSD